MTNFLKTNLKIIIAVFVIVSLLLTSLITIYIYNTQEIEKVTWEYWKNGDERRGGLVIARAVEINKRKEYFLVDFNLSTIVSQTITFFEILKDGSTSLDFETFYLERTGINSFKVKESIISSSTAYTFDEAVEIAKKQDVYKNNPHPDKIFNYPDLNLTPAQIQTNKETADKEKNRDEQIKKDQEEYNNASPTEKIQLLEKDIAKFQKELSETTSESDKKLYLRIIEQMQTEIQRIKNEQVN